MKTALIKSKLKMNKLISTSVTFNSVLNNVKADELYDEAIQQASTSVNANLSELVFPTEKYNEQVAKDLYLTIPDLEEGEKITEEDFLKSEQTRIQKLYADYNNEENRRDVLIYDQACALLKTNFKSVINQW